jgi:NAD(P)H-nitrite reductase large subunit
VLAVAIGVRPRLELAQSAGLKIERGILVDEYLRTSAPHIFAAGDVAQVIDPRSGRASLEVLWSSAREQGRVAGINMAGGTTAYRKGVAMNVTQLAGLITTIIGAVGTGLDKDLVTISRGDSEQWRALEPAGVVYEQQDVNRIRVQLNEGCLVGAIVMGDQTWTGPLHDLISQQVDISSIRAALLAQPAAAFDQLIRFYRDWEATRHAPANV